MAFTITTDEENDNLDLDGNTGTSGDNGSRWHGGKGSMFVTDDITSGDFDSTTIKLQKSEDQSAWIDVDSTDLSFTEAGSGNFELDPCWLRVNVSADGTDALKVQCHVGRIPHG